MKKLLIILCIVISSNCYAEYLMTIIPDDNRKFTISYEDKNINESKERLLELISTDFSLNGKWQKQKSNTVLYRNIKGNIEYYKPPTIKVKFKDVTIEKKKDREVRKTRKDKLDKLKDKLKVKDMNIIQMNNYLRMMD